MLFFTSLKYCSCSGASFVISLTSCSKVARMRCFTSSKLLLILSIICTKVYWCKFLLGAGFGRTRFSCLASSVSHTSKTSSMKPSTSFQLCLRHFEMLRHCVHCSASLSGQSSWPGSVTLLQTYGISLPVGMHHAWRIAAGHLNSIQKIIIQPTLNNSLSSVK